MVLISMLAVFTTSAYAQSSTRQNVPEFTVVYSIYAGWQPWAYANQSGILAKWATKYGIKINFQRMDYIPSVEALVAKRADAVAMTNMEALDMPAASGVSVTSVVMGDHSFGNDAALTRGIPNVAALCGSEVYLVELSVSHYLLARALEQVGRDESCVTLMNTSDSDIAPAFIANTRQKAVVTWNPMVMQIEQQPGVTKIYDSSRIPGEIMDLMVVRTEVLEQHPQLGKALVGAWYEVMGIMTARGPQTNAALTYMADDAGASLAEYKAQLRTTAMYYTPQAALSFLKSSELLEKMNLVRNFCFKHGLLGENSRSVDVVGIRYPNGTVHGDPRNVQFIFDATFTELAAKGQL